MSDGAPQFRIYYADGSTYDGPPFDAPAWGVLTIVERDADHGRRIVDGKDYFIWTGARWRTVDYIGMVDYLAQPGPKRVLFGRGVDNEQWYAVRRIADADPDFPARTAWGADEERVT